MVSEQATGLLLLDKEPGVSSFGAIARLRPVLGRKLGHAGTLDPFASGLLLVLAGKATRLAGFLSGLDKRYVATIQLGVRSTTDDPEGELETGGGTVDQAALEEVLAGFRGSIDQVPPAASAIHIDGERAYARFRRGEVVAMPRRTVVISALELRSFDGARQTAEVDVRCSTGTYIRALARDVGELLGVGGYCLTLRRTEIGSFSIDDAATVQAILAEGRGSSALRPPLEAVRPQLPEHHLTEAEADAIAHGRAVQSLASGQLALVAGGRLVAIGEAADGRLRPTIVLGTSG